MNRDQLIAFARWLLKDEAGEDREEEIVDQYLAEQPERNDATNGPIAWLCYHHDMGPRINAIFAEEIDALRYAVSTGYLNVAPVGSGEISNLP